MKLKLDENLPARLAGSLRALGHDVHTVQDEALDGANDLDVWRAAQAEERILVTQDIFLRHPPVHPRNPSWPILNSSRLTEPH